MLHPPRRSMLWSSKKDREKKRKQWQQKEEKKKILVRASNCVFCSVNKRSHYRFTSLLPLFWVKLLWIAVAKPTRSASSYTSASTLHWLSQQRKEVMWKKKTLTQEGQKKVRNFVKNNTAEKKQRRCLSLTMSCYSQETVERSNEKVVAQHECLWFVNISSSETVDVTCTS